MSSLERKRKWDEPASPSTEGPDAAKHIKTEQHDGPTAAAPLGDPERDGEKAAQAAASIAARLASQYGAAPPPGHAPPPPPPGGGASAAVSAADAMGAGDRRERERERAQGLFVEDIEINDLRNRYLLTKGPTQQQILADTGAAVLTKGVWYPDKSMATEKDPPLYLHITAETADKLEAGVRAVQALIDQELNLLDARRGPPREGMDRDSGYGQRRKWPEEKVLIELEPLRNFNIRAKTVGPGGMFVKWIQQETGTRVQIKGLGSGFIETETGRESDDPLHINVAGPDQAQIDKAAELARDLLKVVTEKHAEARKALDEQRFGGGGGGGGAPFTPSGANTQQFGAPMRFGAGGEQQPQGQSPYSYQPGQYAAPGLTAPLPPGEAPAAGATAEPAGGQAASGMSAEAYSAWWESLDQASKDYYTQYYAAYAQYAAQPAAAAAPPQEAAPAPPSDAPPPPPPSNAPPPPPPPAPPAEESVAGGSGRYGAVPPPQGL
ncbi:hypothetical protein JCM10450v2_007266 [Rhodotorula kratochvilovae]